MLLTPKDEKDFQWLIAEGLLSLQAAEKVRAHLAGLPDDSLFRYVRGGQVRTAAEALDLLTLDAQTRFDTYDVCDEVRDTLREATLATQLRVVMHRGSGRFDPAVVLKLLSEGRA